MKRAVFDINECRLLVERWQVGELMTMELLEAGTINSNYLLETNRGRFFLRVNEGKTDVDVDFEVSLLHLLSTAGVKTPMPLATTAAATAATTAATIAVRRFWQPNSVAKQVMLFPWIEGNHLSEHAVDCNAVYQVGAALASIHAATAPLAPSLSRSNRYSTDAIAGRFCDIRNAHENCAAHPELTEALPVIESELKWLAARKKQRSSRPIIVHGDLFRDNVLFSEGKLVALLDFEQAATATAVYDVAVCVNAWCFIDGAFQDDRVKALVAGYAGAGGPCQEELMAQALWIETRAAAVRFAVTRITDVLMTGLLRPEKNYQSYLARLQALHSQGPDLFEH